LIGVGMSVRGNHSIASGAIEAHLAQRFDARDRLVAIELFSALRADG